MNMDAEKTATRSPIPMVRNAAAAAVSRLEGRHKMTKRCAFLTVLAAAVGLAAAAAAAHAGTNASRLTYLTFSGPVALPGVSLTAGTYAFELADSTGAA